MEALLGPGGELGGGLCPKQERRRHRRQKWLRHGLWASCVALFAVAVVLRHGFSNAHSESILDATDEWIILLNVYMGDASFAFTGVLAAGSEGLDLCGCVVVGFVTALGGGSSRDIVLGRLPLFWLRHWDEFTVVLATTLATVLGWPRLCPPGRPMSEEGMELIVWTDALGLAVFAAVGAHYGSLAEPRLHLCGCGLCGMFTATFGGVTRDVLLKRPVRILHNRDDSYAPPALAGGMATAVYMRASASDGADPHSTEAILLGVAVTALLRVVIINRGGRLPTLDGSVGAGARARAGAGAGAGGRCAWRSCLDAPGGMEEGEERSNRAPPPPPPPPAEAAAEGGDGGASSRPLLAGSPNGHQWRESSS
jgi:uncharacterized membrane protein YeiH